MSAALARVVLRLIGRPLASLLNLVIRLTSRRAGVALLYHAIDIRQGDGDRELLPPVERSSFRRQLRYLLNHYEVVPVEHFVAAIAGRRRGGRFPVCLSFDDDLPEHLRHAMPELRELGIPATFFLCGAALGADAKSFWWQRLQRAASRGVAMAEIAELLPEECEVRLEGHPSDIRRISDEAIELSPKRRDEFSADLLQLAGPDPADELLPADGIATLAKAGFTIGFHTRRHDSLTGLDDERLESALRDNRRALEAVAGHPIDAIAYPYGRADGRVAGAAQRAGFKLGFTNKRPAATPDSDPLLVGRLAPVSPSLGVFSARLLSTLLAGNRAADQ